jgi:transposase
MKLARSYRSGDLTPVWVPDATHEALRDLVRAQEAAKKDQLRARHRLGKFLLRHGRRPPTATTPWTQKHLTWVKTVHFAHDAQEATLSITCMKSSTWPSGSIGSSARLTKR